MVLFTVKKEDDNNIRVCLPPADEDVQRKMAQIEFSSKTPKEGINIKEILGNDFNEVMSINRNPIDMLDDIYKFIYGKPIEEMYVGYDYNNRAESRRLTGAIEWTKERAVKINWELLLATLYAFYFSKENFYSDVWKSLSQLLEFVKEFNNEDWKRVLFGKTHNIANGVNEFWSSLHKILFLKSSHLMNESINNVGVIEYVRPFLDDDTANDLELHAYSELKKQLVSELNRFKNTEGVNSDNVVELYYSLRHFVSISAENFTFIQNQDILEKINILLSDAFDEIGNISTLHKSYNIANKSYIYAIIFTNDANKIATLRQKNKRVCEFVDKKERVYEKSEKHDRRRKSDFKYDNKIRKIKDIGEKILIPSVVIFALATLVFLILMIIGLIVSNGLFAFSWKAMLASLGLTILAFVSLYYTTEKL